jgi:hypothetical protein
MKNRFEKYLKYVKENGKIVNVSPDALKLADEAFLLFKSMYNTNYGSINEEENLISIHSGGWSDNEELIREFEETGWWLKNHEITARGGHYYFDTDFHADKEWEIVGMNATKFNWRKLKDSVPIMTPTQWSEDVLLVDEEGKQWIDTLFYDTGGKPLFWLSRRTDATHWMPLPFSPVCT